MKALCTACVFSISAFGYGQQAHFNNAYPLGDGGLLNDVFEHTGRYTVIGWGGSPSSYDGVVIQADSNGDELWRLAIADSHFLIELQWALELQGDYLAGGSTRDPQTGQYDYLIVRIDSSGDTIWWRQFGDSIFWEGTRRAVTDGAGNYVICAFKNTLGVPLWGQAVIMYLDTAGNLIWSQEYGSSGTHEQPVDFIQTRDSGYLMAGYRVGPFAGDKSTTMLIKADSVGNHQWTKYYGQGSASGICRSQEGGYMVSGFKPSPFAGGVDRAWLMKIDEGGNTEWEKYYDLVEDSTYRCGLWRELLQLPDSSYVAIGWGQGKGRIIKTDWQGNMLWQRGYLHLASQSGANHGHYFYGMDTTSDGGFIVCGHSNWENTSQDGWLVKLDEWGCDTPGCQIGDTTTTSLQLPPKERGQLAVYPNPNNGTFTVQLPNEQQWQVQLFDLSGRLVEAFAVPPLGGKGASASQRWDVSHLPKGLYLLRATAEDGTNATVKVVVE